VSQYAVLLFGEGYLLAHESGPPQKYDFFVWRCVEADSQATAEVLAVQMVRDDPELNATVRNAPDTNPTLRVRETRRGFGDLQPPGSGYIFVDNSDKEDEQTPAQPPNWLASFGSKLRRLGGERGN